MNEEIKELIDNKNYGKAKEELLKLNIVDIAMQLTELPDDELMKMFRLMPKDIASDIFSYFPIETEKDLITKLSSSEATAIIEDLFADDATDFLEEMPAKVVTSLLAGASEQTRKHINHLLQYPEDSAGSIMTVEFVDVKENLTVKEALEKVRAEGVDKETVNYCYVIDPERRLLGSLSLRRLLLSKPDDIMKDIMNPHTISVKTHDDQEEVAHSFQKYDLNAMPVVDSENRLVGIITIDDVIDIIQNEASEDIAKMAAIKPSTKPYLKTSLFRIYLDRLPWLLILLISATFTGIIIRNNETVLAGGAFGIFLTAALPMLMDSAGNAGSQANVTIIRAMTLNEVSVKDTFRVLWKEARVSVLLGLTMAVACFVKLLLIDQLIAVDQGTMVAFVISLVLFFTVVAAKVVGCLMPILAKACKLDPAVVASPIITTVVDAVALIIYCNIALALLPM